MAISRTNEQINTLLTYMENCGIKGRPYLTTNVGRHELAEAGMLIREMRQEIISLSVRDDNHPSYKLAYEQANEALKLITYSGPAEQARIASKGMAEALEFLTRGT